MFVATRRFVILKDLKICMADCKPENKFEDNVMSVRYIPITKIKNRIDTDDLVSNNKKSLIKNDKNDGSEDETDYYAHERKKNIFYFRFFINLFVIL